MWETIKKVLQKHGGTCIIIEEGKPAYIVTKFSEYGNAVTDKQSVSFPSSASEPELLEKINQEISNWKIAQAEQQAANLVDNPDEEVKIEDLPL